MREVDNSYISNAIHELVGLLGVKEDIDREIVLRPLKTGNAKKAVEGIANYLGLPISVNISFSDKFESSSLTKTDDSGRGIGNITAQVSIPSYLPLYGSSELQGFPISVKISQNFQRYPETFMTVIAHEIAHIVLHSLWHKEKNNEFYTDLTAMILGFASVMKDGRKIIKSREKFMSTETLTTTYGYLSDEKFDFAFNRIDDILTEQRYFKTTLSRKLTTYRQQLSSYRQEFFKFNKFSECIDKNQRKRIKSEDGAKIVEFHHLDYAHRFTIVIISNEERLNEIHNYCMGIIHYNKTTLESLQKFDSEIDSLILKLSKEFDLLKNDTSIMRKYVGFFYKRKIDRQSTLI